MVWSCYYVIPPTDYGKNKKAISAINATFASLTPLTHQIIKSHHKRHYHINKLLDFATYQ